MKRYKVILTEAEMRRLNEMNIDTNSGGFRFKDKNGKPTYAAQVLMFLNDRPDGSATKKEMVFYGIDIYGMSAGVLTKLKKAGLITLDGSVWTITDEGIELADSLGSWKENRNEKQKLIFDAQRYRNKTIKLIKKFFEKYENIENIYFNDPGKTYSNYELRGTLVFDSTRAASNFSRVKATRELEKYLKNNIRGVDFGVTFIVYTESEYVFTVTF